jgi:signal transduction histidine kinase
MINLWRVSVRRILFGISLLFLVLPLGGIYFLRIYESSLIRQTESELISQAAFVSALYRSEISQATQTTLSTDDTTQITPVPAHLDLARDTIYPPRPWPLKSLHSLAPEARQAAQQLLPVLRNAQKVTLSGIKILDEHGTVVAGKEEQGLSFAHTKEFQQASQGKPVSLLRKRRMPKEAVSLNSLSRNSDINVFVALPIYEQNRLIGVAWLNRTPTNLWQALYSKQTEIVWTSLLLVTFTLLISALTSFTITRPLRNLIRKTHLIAKGDPRGLTPLRHPITSEVSELSEQIAKMAQTLQYRTEYIQNFATHVSHEFKTPLTAIQGSIELLQDNLTEMPMPQQQRFLNNIAEDTHRLKLLVNRLLELAQADTTEKPNHTLDLPDFLQQLSANKQSPLIIQIPSLEAFPTLNVTITEDSLNAVFSHLLENSLQAGATTCDISITVQSQVVILQVQDNGPGISNANQKTVFTPFFTTKREQGGTGLGLSIAKSLLERQGGKLTFYPSNQGACFQITLPLT